MTERERLLKVLKGETPDRVPWFADLGHWYRAESGEQWDLFGIMYSWKPDTSAKEIADLHREVKAGLYIPPLSLHDEYYEDGVIREKKTVDDLAIERYITPIGTIYMERKWSPLSFSWNITKRWLKIWMTLKYYYMQLNAENSGPYMRTGK